MQICYMRIFKKPPKFARLLSKTSKYYNIEIVYAHPEDVNIEQEVIHGQVLVDNEWVEKDVPIPPYIDLNTYCYRYKEEMKFLKERSHLSTNGMYGGKEKVYRLLEEDGEFADLLIPSRRAGSFEEFAPFIHEHQSIILKPRNGHKGQGIYLIEKVGQDYIWYHGNEEKTMSVGELKTFIEEMDDKYLWQKYVKSTTPKGEPFDTRLRLEKNGKGNWEVTTYLVRIGAHQKVVANVAQGGCVSKLQPYLKANFDNWEEVSEKIKTIGKKLPYKIEELSNKRNIAMGIDLGIEQSGEVYLFEINSSPGTEFGESELANIKPDYYNYILKQLQK
ncbi:YheC/YheD family protein [Thalassobacillus devorans]|uniref:YheC/YheD family protein n=1 Tax=Thalassobacillus devorans TaxID=279813 RepID=UPI000A1C90A9|nr:YheC/YheD family protein [Thalassobacillus devorans]